MQKIAVRAVAVLSLLLAASPALAGDPAPVPSMGPGGLLVLVSGIGVAAWIATNKRR